MADSGFAEHVKDRYAAWRQRRGKAGFGRIVRMLLELSARLRPLPHFVRYGAAAAVVFAAFGLCLVFPALRSADPFLPFLPIVVLNALVLNRGSGIASVILSAMLAALWLTEPAGSVLIDEPGKLACLVLFGVTGIAIAAIIGELHKADHDLSGAVSRADEAQARAGASEAGKALLLHELSHRLRNDLQTLVALLEMQAAAQPPGSPAREALAAAVTRTHVLARAHARLARLGDSEAVVATHEFLTSLCGDLRVALIGERPIAFVIEAENHILPLGRAISLGLVLNEAVINALKHAFPGGQAGEVVVRFGKVAGDQFELSVTDDGVGGRPDAAEAVRAETAGSGRRIVRALAARLGGVLVVGWSPEPNRGTICTLRFPVGPEPATAAQVKPIILKI